MSNESSLNAATPPPLSDEDAQKKLDEVCKLDELTYQRQRDKLAKELGITVGGLDKARQTKNTDNHANDDDMASEITDGIEPWPEPVNGAQLADSLATTVKRYCILEPGTDVTIALWIMAHYCIDHCRIFPKLLVSSPQKRCGKTTLLEVLQSMCNRAFMASNVSAAVIFRIIEAYNPTLLLDEADTWIHNNEELRGIINSGNTKSSAVVWRIEGDDRKPTPFSTFAPMVLAMIGTPPDTILDRSVPALIRRKMTNESVERLPIDLHTNNLELRRKLKRWADDNGHKLRDIEPVLPKLNNDRMADNFGPLAAVAMIIGGDWNQKLADVVKKLNEKPEDTGDDDSILLLRDLNELFTRRKAPAIHSIEIVQALNELEDRSWQDLRFGKGISQHKLAAMLKPFEIGPKQERINEKNAKAYTHSAIIDAYVRYTSPQTETTETTETSGGNTSAYESITETLTETETTIHREATETETQTETLSPHKHRDVSDVSDVSLVSGGRL